jgi:phospholipase A1
MHRHILAIGLLTLSASAVWAQPSGDAAECAAIVDNDARLRCYDRVAGRSAAPPAEAAPAAGIWGERIRQDAARETFTLTARKPNYLMYTSVSNANQAPYEFTGAADRLDKNEIKFQLSMQTKAVDDLFGRNGDLWFSYSQVVYWQAFNSEISSAFRETNYEPDVYLSFLTDYPFLGLTGRSINVGVVHQSNGRAEPLSRSWNRVYADILFDRGNFAFRFKPWVRLSEDEEDDDNPDIENYLGHYELQAMYAWNRQLFTLMLRNIDDDDNRYNSEIQWSFPIARRLRGLVQWYNGYGENLIDYNFNTHRIGVGVMMTDWL